jgi:sulfite dehydrogenase
MSTKAFFRKLGFLLVVVASGVMSCANAAEVTIQLPPEVNSFKQDAGAEIANAQCLICHSVEYITTQPKMPRAFWKAGVQKMQQKYGAPISDEQVEPVVDYLVKNYGVVTNAPGTSAPGTGSQVTSVASKTPADGPGIATKYGCLGCHSANVKIIGPAYRDIAAKYKTDADGRSKIAEQVQKGGSGKWGPVLMPPFPQVSEGEVTILSQWILGLK